MRQHEIKKDGHINLTPDFLPSLSTKKYNICLFSNLWNKKKTLTQYSLRSCRDSNGVPAKYILQSLPLKTINSRNFSLVIILHG